MICLSIGWTLYPPTHYDMFIYRLNSVPPTHYDMFIYRLNYVPPTHYDKFIYRLSLYLLPTMICLSIGWTLYPLPTMMYMMMKGIWFSPVLRLIGIIELEQWYVTFLNY